MDTPKKNKSETTLQNTLHGKVTETWEFKGNRNWDATGMSGEIGVKKA